MMEYPEMPNELSWFECFVDPSVVAGTIADPEKKKQLPRLCIQFTEKGFLAEKEKDKGKLAYEELMLFERKAASMRLCAMAAFAALDYDIDYIIDNISRNELLTLRVLADNFYKIYNEKNLDATFGNWLFYRFVLSIDRRNRLPPPPPSATIPSTFSNGQLMPTDPALIRHEKVQRMITELREHVLKARAFITELAEEPREVVAPGVECFLKPFKELAPKAMTAALVGNRDVLVEHPSADFEVENIKLPAADVANKCLSELVVFLFAAGDLTEARRILNRVGRPSIPHPLVAIDEAVFKSYSMMLNVKGAFIGPAESTAIKSIVFDQKVLADDTSIYRRSEFYRYRGGCETTGQLQQVYLAENAAWSVVEGKPDYILKNLGNKAQVERFVKVLKKKLDEGVKWDKWRMTWINAQLKVLCSSVKDLKEMLKTAGIDVSSFPDCTTEFNKMREESPKPPTLEELSALHSSADPFWTMMTEWDVLALRTAVAELGSFWFPNTLQPSEFLYDILEVNSPNYTLQRVLLAKLNQLMKMLNAEGYSIRLREYFANISGSQIWVIMATFDSIHVLSYIGNKQCFRPWERKYPKVDPQNPLLIFKAEFRPTDNSAKMINQCLALLLNYGQAREVLDKGGKDDSSMPIDQFKCIPVARILGAYLINLDDINTQKKCADGLWRTVTVKFNEAQQRASQPEALYKANRKELQLMLHLFELIREPLLLDFLLAYAACLNNKVMGLTNKSAHNSKIHAKLLHLYKPTTDGPRLAITNPDDVRQFLRTQCEIAHEICPTDPDTLRTYADFLFTEKDYQGAGKKYMEFFCAYSPSLRLNTADMTIFDESVLHRLRMCLAHAGYLTMSMLVCQLMKVHKKSEYQKAMHLLRNNETRDVGANCAEFVIDMTAVELLSGYYQENRMTKSLNTLYAGASSLAGNKNVPVSVLQQEVNRRTTKFLTAIASIYFGLHT